VAVARTSAFSITSWHLIWVYAITFLEGQVEATGLTLVQLDRRYEPGTYLWVESREASCLFNKTNALWFLTSSEAPLSIASVKTFIQW
jgi:hypothetical protein